MQRNCGGFGLTLLIGCCFLGGAAISAPRMVKGNLKSIPVEQTAVMRWNGEVAVASTADADGYLYVTGTNRDGTAYVARLAQNGSQLLFSANLKGKRDVRAIAVDADGFIWIAGSRGQDAFVAKLHPKGYEWSFDRTFAGQGRDAATALALAPDGSMLVAGWTMSPDFPVRGAVQAQLAGTRDAFVMRLDAAGHMLFGTYVGGGNRAEATGVGADREGNIYLAGTAYGRSSGLIPSARDEGDAFLLTISPEFRVLRSETLGGSGADSATSLFVQPDGSTLLGGWTESRDFPALLGSFSAELRDGFLASFGPQGERRFVTFLGGEPGNVAADAAGNSYVISRNQGSTRIRKISADGATALVDGAIAEDGSLPPLAVDFKGRAYLGASAISTCDYRISSQALAIGQYGGEQEITVDTSSECMWTPKVDVPWMSIQAGSVGKNTLKVSVAPNGGLPRSGDITIAGQNVSVEQSGSVRQIIKGAMRTNAGFQLNQLPPGDDNFQAAALGFSVNFFGQNYTSVSISTNGNVTLGINNVSFSPSSFANLGQSVIAAYWADANTTPVGGTSSGVVTYGQDIVGGRKAFGVTWNGIARFGGGGLNQRFNSFQLVLIDRADTGTIGAFDIEFNYGLIEWESSGGSGLGGTNTARVGFASGAGTTGSFFEMPGSGIAGSFIDGGTNSLVLNTNAGLAGRFVYPVRATAIVCGTGITPPAASVAQAGATLTISVIASNPSCGWSVSALPSWITLAQPAGGSGTGNGEVKLNVAANNGGFRNVVITIGGQSYAIDQPGITTANPPLRFVPLTPCRVVDTRNATGLFGGPNLAPGTSRSFPLPSGQCGVPGNVAAYTVNVTVVPRGGLSYLTIWPTGQVQPFVSTLNSFDGRIKANAAIVPAGTGGALSVFATDATDVILDINGYFLPAVGSSSLALYPMNPCRLVDTRNPNSTLAGPILTAGLARTFPLLDSPCNIPSNVQAYSLNMTAVPSGGLGYITTFPTGIPQPLVSTLNSPTGTVVANAAIIPAGDRGEVSVFPSNPTHIVIDTNGYFAPPGPGGLNFYTIPPCRVFDTRNPAGPFGGPTITTNTSRNFLVPQSACNIPATASAYSVNVTTVPQGFLAYLTLFPGGGAVPFVSTLNAFDGAITSNAAIVPAGPNGGLGAFVSNTADVLVDINGYFAP